MATVDLTERESRRSLADGLRSALADQGVVAVATSFVDKSGITRVKSVPLDRLPQLAAWGLGFRPASTTSGSTTGWRPLPGAWHQLAICVSCPIFSELSRSSPSPVGRGRLPTAIARTVSHTRTAAASCCGG